MPLTFDNFRKEIPAPILARGRNYFESGRVIELVETEPGVWMAAVEGNEIYDVDIAENSDLELLCSCTCPYSDENSICKHAAAVLYAITNEFVQSSGGASEPRQEQQENAQMLSILQQLSREELVEIVAGIARHDRKLCTQLLLRFGKGLAKKQYDRMIDEALSLGQGRHGDYLDWDGARRAGHAVQDILHQAQEWVKSGQGARALPLLQATLDAVIPALGGADDSSGTLGECAATAIDLLHDVAEQLGDRDTQAVFEYCLEAAPGAKQIGWSDWAWDLAQLAADLTTTSQQRREIFAVLDQMGTERESGFGSLSPIQYDLEMAEMIKLSIVERLDGERAAADFITGHAHLDRFRMMMIERHLERREFQEVKRLCRERLESIPASLPGLQDGYLTVLLDVAQRTHDDTGIVDSARTLLLRTHDFKFYDLVKKTVPSNEWPGYVRALVQDARQSRHAADIAIEIYARESMWKDLLEAVRQQPTYLLSKYDTLLARHFPEEVSGMYESMVFQMLAAVSNRGVYAQAAEYLSRMKVLGQKKRAAEVIDRLVASYPNRRAMIEELRRVQH